MENSHVNNQNCQSLKKKFQVGLLVKMTVFIQRSDFVRVLRLLCCYKSISKVGIKDENPVKKYENLLKMRLENSPTKNVKKYRATVNKFI